MVEEASTCRAGHPLVGANAYPRVGYGDCWVCKLLERQRYWRSRGREYVPGPGALICIERLRSEGFAVEGIASEHYFSTDD